MAKKEYFVQCRASVGSPIVASKPWKQDEPVKFIYAPAGVHTITAGYKKGAITITVENDEQTAEDLQDSFNRMTAANPKQEAYADEDHDSKKATLRFPTATTTFEWGTVNGEQGVVVAAVPTSYGAEAVNGKVYRSWSPEFGTDADVSKAVCLKCSEHERDCECSPNGRHIIFPEGVKGCASMPARINQVSFIAGALTNKPAFQAMPPVKAKSVEFDPTESHNYGDYSPTFKKAAMASAHAHVITHLAQSSGHGDHHDRAANAHHAAMHAHKELHAEAKASGLAHHAAYHSMMHDRHSYCHHDHMRMAMAHASDATEPKPTLSAHVQTETKVELQNQAIIATFGFQTLASPIDALRSIVAKGGKKYLKPAKEVPVKTNTPESILGRILAAKTGLTVT